jgi:urea ABC transporter ATP-binding protein UrtE
MLELENVVSGYGKSRVLNEVGFAIGAGERVVLLGRNGMGKTTLARTVVGLLPLWSGSIELNGRDLRGTPTHRRIRNGLGYVPQGRGLFPQLSVLDNLKVGLHGQSSGSRELPTSVFEYFPVLYDRRHQMAGTLSGGEQQQLAIARALVGDPSVLILDEPSEGIQPNIVTAIADRLRSLATERGIAVLLIEQNIDAALRFAERCLFIENGALVHVCEVDELRDESLVGRLLGV